MGTADHHLHQMNDSATAIFVGLSNSTQRCMRICTCTSWKLAWIGAIKCIRIYQNDMSGIRFISTDILVRIYLETLTCWSLILYLFPHCSEPRNSAISSYPELRISDRARALIHYSRRLSVCGTMIDEP